MNRTNPGYEPSLIERLVHIVLADPLGTPVYRKFTDRIELRGNERALDYGSGSGTCSKILAKRLREHGGSLTCVDISQNWMRTAKRKLRRFQNVDYQLGDVRELDMEESSYDLVTIHFALHDIPSALQQDRVSRLSGLLKEGGLLYIKEPTRTSHGISPERINTLMRNAGLEEKESEEIKNSCFAIYVKVSRQR